MSEHPTACSPPSMLNQQVFTRPAAIGARILVRPPGFAAGSSLLWSMCPQIVFGGSQLQGVAQPGIVVQVIRDGQFMKIHGNINESKRNESHSNTNATMLQWRCSYVQILRGSIITTGSVVRRTPEPDLILDTCGRFFQMIMIEK